MTEQVQESPIQVTTKDPKKVEAGKRLAAYNKKKREDLKKQTVYTHQDQPHKDEVVQQDTMYYSIGGLVAIGLVGAIVYHIYRGNSTSETTVNRLTHVRTPVETPPQPTMKTPQQVTVKNNNFEME